MKKNYFENEQNVSNYTVFTVMLMRPSLLLRLRIRASVYLYHLSPVFCLYFPLFPYLREPSKMKTMAMIVQVEVEEQKEK